MMAKSKLQREMMEREAAQPIEVGIYEDMAAEEILRSAYENRQQPGLDSATSMTRANTRLNLMQQRGQDYYNIDDISRNPKNKYKITETDVRALADSIYETTVTEPIIIIEDAGGGYRLIDGERRYRAHKLLAEERGEIWKMIPAQCFKSGELTEAEEEFLLNALNVNQRSMTSQERARGFAAMADFYKSQRTRNPKESAGATIAALIAEQQHVSERTVNMEINLGRNLSDEGFELLDEQRITKTQADAIARLETNDQKEVLASVSAGELAKKDVMSEVKRRRNAPTTRIPRTSDDYLRAARRELKKAVMSEEKPDRVLVAELRNLLDMLDPDLRSEEG